jgi:hypothetical protein
MHRDNLRVAWQRAASAIYVAIAAYCGYVLVVTLLAVARR